MNARRTARHRFTAILGGAGVSATALAFYLIFAVWTPGARPKSTAARQILLPIEVLGADGTVASRDFELTSDQPRDAHLLWLQTNGVKYSGQASVQVNGSAWIAINNDTTEVAEPGKSFGGIGGGFSTLEMTIPVPDGAPREGTNTIRFRFDRTDGLSSGFRVLVWNFLTSDGRKILPPDVFAADAPDSWKRPLPDEASVEAGRELWHGASLVANSQPDSPRIRAHCADCHTQDGRDLKYFNFSNHSIVTRSEFHGLSELQGEQIASYVRGLDAPNPGRPWNPPYQPGPGLDDQPVANWAAGAGLRWVLRRDEDALPYFLDPHFSGDVGDAGRLLGKITADVFRPDGNLNPRDIPIALQLPDWSEWLPRIHPKDAWGPTFDRSELAALYDSNAGPTSRGRLGKKRSLRALLASLGAAPESGSERLIAPAFAEWSQARAAFLHGAAKSPNEASPDVTNRIYSTQLWQLVKTWEMMQEFSLEGRAEEIVGPTVDRRSWFSTIPKETAPLEARIPDGPSGVGGSSLINEYFNAAWYEVQILLYSGGHQHHDRAPIDWVYLVGRFHNLYDQTHRPEPTRLLIAVTKALQSTDPHVGPEDYNRGWRPEQNVDPRIMIDADWAPLFQPLPPAWHRALTSALLAAWMGKNEQYPLAKFMPVSARQTSSYALDAGDLEITGGSVWEAAEKFREAGVALDLVQRLENWGVAYTDRAARLQYH